MQVIGFNFTKISATRDKEIKNPSINTNISFIEIEKEKLELVKDKEALRLDYKFVVTYQDSEQLDKAKDKSKVPSQAEVNFEGNIILLTEEEESKEIIKSWKKKELLTQFRMPLFNLILKKCSAKALSLQEELNMPSHIPIPQVTQKKE